MYRYRERERCNVLRRAKGRAAARHMKGHGPLRRILAYLSTANLPTNIVDFGGLTRA